ncbi:methyltransferase domain-containing protein [Vampirovibrio sp.]|uniref:class I SAM-dependent methyltransferase n=1 Tax=Vampirovibrio sp. TaxID=2717857 RepID=UPI0035937300
MPEPLNAYLPAYQDEFLYALDNRLILNWYPQRIMSMAQGDSLLELGVGHGFSTHLFAQHFKRHVVLEGSSAVIQQFQQNFPDCGAEIVAGYFETFETTERFDVIVMGFVLEHVDAPEVILSRFKSFLKPGGSIYLTVPNAEALNKRLGYEAGLLPSLFQLGAGDLALGHQRLFSVETLKTLVQQCGYRCETLEGIFLKPITTQQIQTLALSEAILQGMLKVGIHYPELCVALFMEIKEAETIA